MVDCIQPLTPGAGNARRRSADSLILSRLAQRMRFNSASNGCRRAARLTRILVSERMGELETSTGEMNCQ